MRQTHVISLAGLSRHAELLSGSWPGSGAAAGAVPAAAPATLARSLHLAPGMIFRLDDRAPGPRSASASPGSSAR